MSTFKEIITDHFQYRTQLVKLAKAAITQDGLDLLECNFARRLMAMAGDVHNAHSGSYT